jgi:hypothetical protein
MHLLSIYHGTEVVNAKHTQKDGTKTDVQAPVVIQDYNSHTEGVDKTNMLRSLYDHNKRWKKWWHRLFFAMTETALVKSFVIYSELYCKIPFLNFK